METANDTAMHVTETKTLCSSLNCTPSKSEEITKDREEELLCGNSEDGDEEDALSDDSMRLRLSDDEAELDEPSASVDVTNKQADQDGAKMELGPDIPTIDTWAPNDVLKIQNLSNGTCTVDSKSMRVDQEDQGSNDALVKNDVPDTDGYEDTSGISKLCNGDSEQPEIKSTDEASINQMQANKWKFAGHFGEYSSRAYRVSQSRKLYSNSNKYASDPYNDKYYNKNTHYGSAKSSGRSYNSYHRESINRDETFEEKATPRVSSPVIVSKESEKLNIPSDSNEAIESKLPATEFLDFHNVVSNNVKAEPNKPNESHESVNNSNETDALLKNDDNAIVSYSVNSLIPEEIPQIIDPSHDDTCTDLNLNDKSSNMTLMGENEETNVNFSSDATLVGVDLNNSTETELNDDKEVSAEIESESAGEKGLDNDKEDTEKTTERIDEHGEPEKTDEQENMVTSGDNYALQSSMEAKVVAEEIETEDTAPIESSDGTSLGKPEIKLAAELEKCDNLKEIDAGKTEVDELNHPESPKPEPAVEETEKSQEEKTATPAKQCNVVTSQQALEETLILATNDSETVEKADVSVAKGNQGFDIEAHIADLPDEKETSSEDEGEVNNVRMPSSLKRTSTESLDEMELFKRIRIQQKNNESGEPIGNDAVEEVLSMKTGDVIKETDNNASTIVNPVTNSIADDKSSSESGLINNTVVENPASQSSGKSNDIESGLADGKENIEKIDDTDVIEVPVKKNKKRNRRSLQTVRDTRISQEDTQEKENVRQKRRTAKNAEEIIRKEFLGNSDSESNDSAGNFVPVNYNKSTNSLRSASPPTLKRNYAEEDEKLGPSTLKKLKQDLDSNGDVSMKSETSTAVKLQALAHVRRFFRRDNNGRLAKLKQEELEELLIQKVVETITMRDEIGKLREQAKISERNQEATRQKCQQLSKQIKDFEMVLNRYQSDRRSNPEKTVVPIKINRSVGLQVNFVTDHGIQNLRQLGQIQKAVTPIVNGTSSPQQSEPPPGGVPVPKRTLKVRSPRRPEPPIAAAPGTTVPTPAHSQPIISNITPAALVVTKNVTDSRTPVTPTVQQTSVPHLIAPKQTIPVNGPVLNQQIRQAAAIQVSKSKNSDLIDLTQEEDKTKSSRVPQNTILTTAITDTSPSIANMQKIAPRYHTVIQTLPSNVAFTAQPGIRVVQPSSQPTPTALVNNMNAPRLAYVMQGGIGSTRQVVVTSAPAPIRPAPTIRTSYPLSGTITNGTVRVIPMSSTATIPVYKHPAALPESLNSPSNPSWKLPPPAPSLKISKVANGIVLSWNMALSEKYADIASYQLYAYQEVSGIPPSSTLWKKVGDVRALPLPMACTLTQFSEGNNYYFAVRAVDKHSRLGMYSQPGNISL